MEKTTKIEQNLDTLQELEKLCGCSISMNFHFGSVKKEVVKGEIGSGKMVVQYRWILSWITMSDLACLNFHKHNQQNIS